MLPEPDFDTLLNQLLLLLLLLLHHLFGVVQGLYSKDTFLTFVGGKISLRCMFMYVFG